MAHHDESLRFRRLAERAALEDDSALHAYQASLGAAQDALAAAAAQEARARGRAAGEAARAAMAARASAAARAAAAERAGFSPAASAPPWQWLPPPPPAAAASSHALAAALSASLRASPRYHPSNCDTMLGETGACPAIVAAQRREAAAGLAQGLAHARRARAAAAEEDAAHAQAADARDAALQALAGVQREEQREARAQLAAFRGRELEGKRRAKEREAQADAAAEARARAEAEGSVGAARFAARAPPSPRSVREALDAQVLERERLAGEERAWQGAADAAMLGYSAAAQQIG